MARARARFTEADLKRAMRAAEAVGPQWAVIGEADGTIRMERVGPRDATRPQFSPKLVTKKDIVF